MLNSIWRKYNNYKRVSVFNLKEKHCILVTDLYCIFENFLAPVGVIIFLFFKSYDAEHGQE